MATTLDENVLGPNMLDLMYTTLSRQLADIGGIMGMGTEEIAGLGSSFVPLALRAGWTKDQAVPANGAPIGPIGGETATGSFTTPICDLFIELFDLKESNWIRRQAIVLILQQFLGSTIERSVTLRSRVTYAERVEKSEIPCATRHRANRSRNIWRQSKISYGLEAFDGLRLCLGPRNKRWKHDTGRAGSWVS